MDYKQLVQSSARNGEAAMWESVGRISGFLHDLKKENPDAVRRFLKQEYEALNGRHLNETVARALVADMHHTDTDEKVVRGEAVTPDEAMQLLDGMSDECRQRCRWDAYAAANAFAHDLANANLSRVQLLTSARLFWFHDEDFSDNHKVYWYFEWMLFQ